MMRTAYLIFHFDLMVFPAIHYAPLPVFKEAGIYSEGSNTLTTEGPFGSFVVDIMSFEGSDYQEARDGLVEKLAEDERFKDWIFKHISMDI